MNLVPLFIFNARLSTAAFSPQSTNELRNAVNDCISRDELGDCSRSIYFGPIGEWDVSGVTEMTYVFAGTPSFNADISNWNVERVTDMSTMFHGATSFDADISKWNVSSVTNTLWMFYGATSFNADISNWNMARVTDTRNMFGGAASFNADLSQWNVGRVTNMELMFSRAKSFNGDISKWNVARVTDTRNMFGAAISFNADISKWNVARVTRMSYMFYEAASFNADISKWNVARVTHMLYMFSGAISFNVDISKWNVARVVDMSSMFNGATSFKQTLCPWVHSRAQKFDMFYGSSGSICATSDCPKCGIDKVGQLSCCFRGGAWFRFCVNVKPSGSTLKHTWFEGTEACKNVITTSDTTAAMTTCPKCGRKNDGRVTCCGEGGSWHGQCGMVGDTRFEHTWSDGEKSCAPKLLSSSTSAPAATTTAGTETTPVPTEPITTAISRVCPKCGTNAKSGKLSCCAPGGAWFKNCGDPGDSKFEHTWFKGNQACEPGTETTSVPTESITTSIGRVCPKCVIKKNSGKLSCCAPGGAWFNNCGNDGDSNSEHTWLEGIQACERKLYTADTETTPVATEPITTAISRVCPKCGTNAKSGKLSCCAPGGAWFKKCGNPGESNFEHTWFEGNQACEPGTETTSVTSEPITTSIGRACPKCVIKKKSGKLSCCAPGGAWFNNCGNDGDSNFEHTWLEGIQACSDFDSKFSGEAQEQVVLPLEQKAGKQFPYIRKGSAAPQQTGAYVDARVFDDDTTACKDCSKLAKLVSFANILVLILYIQI